MAGLQNNRGRKRRAVAVGFKLLTAAPTILPTPYPTTPTTSYYSLPTLWPAFRIIVDESAARVAVGFKLLTAAPTILPTPYPTTPTTSYYSPPTLWPAFRIIVDESAAGRPGETSNDQIRPVTSAAFPSLAQARKKRTLGCVCGCRGDASGDIQILGAGFL